MFKGPVIGSYRADVSWAIIFFWLPAVLIQTVLLHFRYRTKQHDLDSFNKKYKYINAQSHTHRLCDSSWHNRKSIDRCLGQYTDDLET